jgi:DNA-binding response OmpR family regulator
VNERILIVDDDPTVHEVARPYLERAGYVVESAMTGTDGLALTSLKDFGVVVVDQRLPDLPGDAVLEEVRRRSPVPVLMLSGAGGAEDRVHALTIGADDYLTKPFSPRELVARVKALLRRGGTDAGGPDQLSFGHGALVIDLVRHEVLVDGTPRQLTRTEFDLLTMLAGRPGRVYSRSELAGRLRGDEAVVSDRVVDSHVANIRAKLEHDPAGSQIIETVRGFGYRLSPTRD